MTSERIKEIQATTGYPDSVSIKQALLQVWNECEQSHPSPMSAEQVEELGKEAKGYMLNLLPPSQFGENPECDRLLEIIHTLSTTPSVKADGWVSVEDGLPTEKDADENGKVLICRNMNEGQKSMSKTIFDWSMVKNCDKTTMWQPLPAAPNVNN